MPNTKDCEKEEHVRGHDTPIGREVADGTVSKWFKKVGDSIVRGEPLFEVSTDKVDTEIPAQSNGILTVILVNEGVTVDVGTILAVIGGSEDSAPVVAKSDRAQLSPVVRRLLTEHNLEAQQVTGTGVNGRITREDVLSAASSGISVVRQSAAQAPLSPVVRRLMSENGIDHTALLGSGPEGRITRHDVEKAIVESRALKAVRQGDEVIPFTRIRRLTVAHMCVQRPRRPTP